MADHAKPTLSSTYTNTISELMARITAGMQQCDPAVTTDTNTPTNTIRWTSASGKWQKWNGTTWSDLASTYNINVAGTVAATTLSASGTVSGAGFSTYLASPPAIGGTAANTVRGTTVTATTQFTGPGTGLTGTAASLSIGGTAAKVTHAVDAAVAGYLSFVDSGTGLQHYNTGLIFDATTGTMTVDKMSLQQMDGGAFAVSVLRINGAPPSPTSSINAEIIGQDSGVNTSATYTLWCKDSSLATMFRVRDNGQIHFGNNTINASPYVVTSGTANAVLLSDGRIVRAASSLRYKRDVERYEASIDEFMALRPVTFRYRPRDDLPNEDRLGGFIAEEVAEIGLDEFVVRDAHGRPDDVRYSNMVALLTSVIQQQQRDIDALRKRLDDMDGEP